MNISGTERTDILYSSPKEVKDLLQWHEQQPQRALLSAKDFKKSSMNYKSQPSALYLPYLIPSGHSPSLFLLHLSKRDKSLSGVIRKGIWKKQHPVILRLSFLSAHPSFYPVIFVEAFSKLLKDFICSFQQSLSQNCFLFL